MGKVNRSDLRESIHSITIYHCLHGTCKCTERNSFANEKAERLQRIVIKHAFIKIVLYLSMKLKLCINDTEVQLGCMLN